MSEMIEQIHFRRRSDGVLSQWFTYRPSTPQPFKRPPCIESGAEATTDAAAGAQASQT